ncbi:MULTISPECIES: hypothetical protein [unclassified Caballeronia]|uniref:hypothetical protein n=1 Tax=unclassified Caballeronia TaxID=2646786 RepID=UPI002855584D|nr:MULTISPECIES: hypothetical protein [unclassified Caballeronia]MDR5754532.1 hypothetical protein [Caballeronia sp. LZ024]MDR5839503.1 hypothetical protein [Caballeronia sp. LZ031]
MTVSNPIGNHAPQSPARTLPLQRNTGTSSAASTKSTTTPATPTRSLPSHLGTTIDTTA